MNGIIAANWPIALLIVLAIAGVPLWKALRHRHPGPGYREARACNRAKRAASGRAAASDAATSDPVPGGPAAAVDSLTIVRKCRAADDDDLAVPAQRHW